MTTTTTTNPPAWLDRNEYPFTLRRFTADGISQNYIDEGQGQPIVFVHGTPSWSFDYRQLIKQLSSKYRCLALDHVGFGLSDKPEQYDYSPQQHSRRLEQWLTHLGVKNFTLVVHDFGGVIGLNYALKQPENIKDIVVFNSWMWSSESEPEYIKFRKILKSPLLPFLYRWLNFSAWYLLPKSFGKHKINKHIHQHYTKPFGKRSERNGTLAFARSLLNDQTWFEELWQQRQRLADKRFLFVWGMMDAFILPKYLDKFASGFPLHTIVKLPDAGHFPQEEAPAEVGKVMEQWLQTKLDK